MISIWRSSLISASLISFIIAYGIHIRSSGQQLFHTVNIAGLLAGLLLNLRKTERRLLPQIFPIALMDYLYIFSCFSSFKNHSIMEVIVEFIFRNTTLLFFTTGLSLTSMFIFVFIFLTFQVYKGITSLVRMPEDSVNDLIILSLTLTRSMVVMIRSSPICFERFISLLLISSFASIFSYRAVSKEFSFILGFHLLTGTQQVSVILSVCFYSIFMSLIISVSEFKSRDYAIFSVFALFSCIALYAIGFSSPFVWDYGIYTVAFRIIVLLCLITVNFICLSLLKSKQESSGDAMGNGTPEDELQLQMATPNLEFVLQNTGGNEGNTETSNNNANGSENSATGENNSTNMNSDASVVPSSQ